MKPNCFIIMGTLDPYEAEMKAREKVKEQSNPKFYNEKFSLFRDVEIVPKSYGYHDRCVVTFSTEIRDW